MFYFSSIIHWCHAQRDVFAQKMQGLELWWFMGSGDVLNSSLECWKSCVGIDWQYLAVSLCDVRVNRVRETNAALWDSRREMIKTKFPYPFSMPHMLSCSINEKTNNLCSRDLFKAQNKSGSLLDKWHQGSVLFFVFLIFTFCVATSKLRWPNIKPPGSGGA